MNQHNTTIIDHDQRNINYNILNTTKTTNDDNLTNPERLPVTNLFPRPPRTCVCHGMEWHNDEVSVLRDINGPYQEREWFLKTPVGDLLTTRGNVLKQMSRLDVFLLVFPPSQLGIMCQETNNKQSAYALSS